MINLPCQRCGKGADYLFVNDRRAHQIARERRELRAKHTDSWQPINLANWPEEEPWVLACTPCMTEEERTQSDYWYSTNDIRREHAFLETAAHIGAKRWVTATDWTAMLAWIGSQNAPKTATKTPVCKTQTRAKQLSPNQRFAILERDRFTCGYCGRSAPEVVLHVDHIEPVSKGGTNDSANLLTACEDCNLGKGSRRIRRAA